MWTIRTDSTHFCFEAEGIPRAGGGQFYLDDVTDFEWNIGEHKQTPGTHIFRRAIDGFQIRFVDVERYWMAKLRSGGGAKMVSFTHFTSLRHTNLFPLMFEVDDGCREDINRCFAGISSPAITVFLAVLETIRPSTIGGEQLTFFRAVFIPFAGGAGCGEFDT